jgi:hypothetical protein
MQTVMEFRNRYHKDRVTTLVNLVKCLQESPFQKRELCREIQESLITVISRTERKIRELKRKMETSRKQLHNRHFRHSKEQSNQIKKKLNILNNKIDEFQEFRLFVKSIGDAVAFLYINRYDLKPQNFKQQTGFITNKKGSRLERLTWRYAFKIGGIAILNDLTNVLRYFDVTIIKQFDDWLPIEVKSGRSRKQLQYEKGAVILDYLFRDTPSDVYDLGYKQHRASPASKIVDHKETVNLLIADARANGYAFKILEEGLFGLAFFQFDESKLDLFLKNQNIRKPYVFVQNSFKLTLEGYYPFILLINDSKDYLDFIFDNLSILIVFDMYTMETLAEANEFLCDFPETREAAIRFRSKDNPVVQFAISEHYFGRIFFEYASPKSLVTEAMNIFRRALGDPAFEIAASEIESVSAPQDLGSFKKYLKNHWRKASMPTNKKGDDFSVE